MKQKEQVTSLFVFFAFAFMVLPLVLSFSDVITKFVERLQLSILLQEFVVPFEAKIIQLLIGSLGIDILAYKDGLVVHHVLLRMSWNCLGWQSLLFFIASLFFGLRSRSYTLFSKVAVVIIGLFGIFWVNIFRIVLIVVLSVSAPPIAAIIYHDVLAAFITIMYLSIF